MATNATAAQLAQEVKSILAECDDLRRPPWRGSPNPVAGHCYVASEVLFFLLRRYFGQWRPEFVRVGGAPHWFLRHLKTRQILDVTADQFSVVIPYDKARRKGFLTRIPSKRAKEMLRRLYRARKRGLV